MTKILLADDVQLYLALEKTFLARSDFQFLTATRGSDALTLFRTERPSLSIVERSLPDMGAFEIRSELLKEPELASIPMVVTTSSVEEKVLERASELGIASVLQKPFNIEDLTCEVEKLLPARSRRYPRRDVYVEVGIRTEHHVQYLSGGTVNVSASGMLVEMDEPLSMNQTVWVQFLLPNDPHLIVSRAKVARYAKEQKRKGPCYGFEFLDIKPDDRERVRQSLERKEARKRS